MPQRQILAVLLRAKLLAAMMVQMGVISERREQQRNSAEQIPHDAKNAERTAAEMDDLVYEQRRAVIQQARSHEQANLFERPDRHPTHQSEADRADDHRHEKIGPINPR